MALILLILIKLALAISMLYGFGMWLYLCGLVFLHRPAMSDAERIEIQNFTFHLGICGIIAAGFLGLIIVFGG